MNTRLYSCPWYCKGSCPLHRAQPLSGHLTIQVGEFLLEEWKCQKALQKGSGLGGVGEGVEKWENGSSGNSEEMRANRSYVSMETVTIIEISIPGWGCSLTQITVENNSMSGEPDRIPKNPDGPLKQSVILGNSSVDQIWPQNMCP